MASAAIPRRGQYNLVAYIQGHGLVIKPPDQVETRQHAPKYEGITMTELSIPGDPFIPGMMGPMNWPGEDSPHWLGKSTESVIPGILRTAFMGTCNNPDNQDNPAANINDAFTGVIEKLKPVYTAAHIEFPEGGFTVRENPPEHQWWQLRRNWEENRRKTPGKQPKRSASDIYVPTASEAYGVFCVCSDHPLLQDLCLTSLKDEDVEQLTHEEKLTSDFIAPTLFPKINMIGHDADGGMLGAQNWINAIRSSKMDPGLQETAIKIQETAIKIIRKATFDKTLYSQDFITVLQALDIGHVWLVNPTCRDLHEEIGAIGDRSPSPIRNPGPASMSPPRPTKPQRTKSPSPPPPQTPASGRTWPNLFGWFKAPDSATAASAGSSSKGSSSKGGSRKSRRRTTHKRRKITRKTKKGAYKRKSQKRNRRK